MIYFFIAVGMLIAVVTLILLVGQPLLKNLQRREAEAAMRTFRIQREQLEAKFFDIASRLGKPRDLRWLDCDWLDRVTFGREVESGLLTAFVAVNIRFEAVVGGDMEDVEAVGTVRDAAALFHYRDGSWGTGGRALFNMNPTDALERLNDQYEAIEASN
ncbi:MAG: hypothetical protein O3B13_17825 [Planctomycetota bacterium]|nr:hypothetical protein [Planctomycetota bacterium]MDA1164958.1 hypothetical protein [Planctomycetota bacterium]